MSALTLVHSGTADPVTVTATFKAGHLCPFKDEVDEGTLTLSWVAAGETLELHSVREWLDGMGQWVVSHEEYTAHVRDEVEKLGLLVAECSTTWTTAGASVVVDA